jgi:hypothetical protein
LVWKGEGTKGNQVRRGMVGNGWSGAGVGAGTGEERGGRGGRGTKTEREGVEVWTCCGKTGGSGGGGRWGRQELWSRLIKVMERTGAGSGSLAQRGVCHPKRGRRKRGAAGKAEQSDLTTRFDSRIERGRPDKRERSKRHETRDLRAQNGVRASPRGGERGWGGGQRR